MTDFGPMLANPKTLILGAAAQFGIFATVIGALLLNKLGVVSFTLKQYQRKRDQVCQTFNVSITTLSRGLASLIQKELLLKENEVYSIHYRLIAYMRLKAGCDYGTAVHETKIK